MSVPNARSKVVDLLQFITPDGNKYDLHNVPKRAVTLVEGFGLPPQVINSTSGPYQHGEDVLSYRLSPRDVNVTIRHNACSKDDYWTYRDTLIDTLGLQRTDPNNPVEGTLRRIYYINGVRKTRDLKVLLTSGLKYIAPPNDKWDQWGINEELVFRAHNPIIYDPTQITSTITTFTSSLRFPFVFPFVLGNFTGTTTINYAGTWFEYPTIVITGPATDVTIHNTTTDKFIRLSGTIPVAETVTIDLTYGAKTVTGTHGEDLLGYITPESNLGDFSLLHDPLVSNGQNIINVYAYDTSFGAGEVYTTSIAIKYYNRYIGI